MYIHKVIIDPQYLWCDKSMNEVKMESICTEFSTVLDRLQAKDCYLVVSAQQATVLQQVVVGNFCIALL